MSVKSCIAIASLFISFCCIDAAEAQSFTIHAGSHIREHTVIRLPAERVPDGVNVVIDAVTATSIPLGRDIQQQYYFILPHKLEPQAKWQLSFGTIDSSAKPALKIVDAQQNLTVQSTAGEQTVFTYHTQVSEPPEKVAKHYRRSGHIHPVCTPQGNLLSDEFPADHLHQHALFAAWTKTSFRGHPVDFWNQGKGAGTVEYRKTLGTNVSATVASLVVQQAYVDLSTDPPVDVLEEDWQIRTYAIPGVHLFDIESTQRCVTEDPLTLKEYLYGGMAFRGSAEWMDKRCQFLTSEGKSRDDGNHTRPNWVAIYGAVQGQPCGLAVFGHPDNFRSPQPVRLHPAMPYFVFSPCVLGDFQIVPGENYVSRYRYYAFDGEPDVAKLNRLWYDYAEPPVVTWNE